MFRLLGEDGSTSAPLEDGLVVGYGLSEVGFDSLYHRGSLALEYDALAEAWALAWDSVPGEVLGSPNDAEIYATLIAGDGAAFDAPYRLSYGADGRSVMPALAIGGSYAVAWHDNRNHLADDTWAGDIYAAALSCP